MATLAIDGAERVDDQPHGALQGAGATTEIVSLRPGEIQGRQFDLDAAGTLPVDRLVADAYHALRRSGAVRPEGGGLHWARPRISRSSAPSKVCGTVPCP
ncbi:hypothetical protein ACIRVK_17805 [Streptomyces sp. NPDC101152]|uniref:hypothetical protein n=1 Tax=Streptomyces sp. NPDC101152 TaxID=3366116 RepID=UPI00380B99B2